MIPRSQKRCPPLCLPRGYILFLTCLLPRPPIVILARLCRFVGSAVRADHKSKSKTMVNRVGDSEGCEGLKRGPVCVASGTMDVMRVTTRDLGPRQLFWAKYYSMETERDAAMRARRLGNWRRERQQDNKTAGDGGYFACAPGTQSTIRTYDSVIPQPTTRTVSYQDAG